MTSREGVPASEAPLVHLHVAEVFDSFYAREYASLCALALVLTGSRAHAEDVAQEAMLAAYQRWDDVAKMEFPAAWVRRVCANLPPVRQAPACRGRALLRLRGHRTTVDALDDAASEFWAAVRRLRGGKHSASRCFTCTATR